MFTSVDELLKRFRREVDDPLEGYDDSHPDSESLWKTHELLQYMNEAVDATAKRTLGLLKTVTLPYKAGNPVVPLPSCILHLRGVLDSASKSQLAEKSFDTPGLDPNTDYGVVHAAGVPGQGSGTPYWYTRDFERRALVLTPAPAADGALELHCAVTLSVPLSCGVQMPFEDYEDQRLVLSFMKSLAYAKQDADALDLSRSQAFRAEWERGVYTRSADVLNMRRPPGVIRMNW